MFHWWQELLAVLAFFAFVLAVPRIILWAVDDAVEPQCPECEADKMIFCDEDVDCNRCAQEHDIDWKQDARAER